MVQMAQHRGHWHGSGPAQHRWCDTGSPVWMAWCRCTACMAWHGTDGMAQWCTARQREHGMGSKAQTAWQSTAAMSEHPRGNREGVRNTSRTTRRTKPWVPSTACDTGGAGSGAQCPRDHSWVPQPTAWASVSLAHHVPGSSGWGQGCRRRTWGPQYLSCIQAEDTIDSQAAVLAQGREGDNVQLSPIPV